MESGNENVRVRMEVDRISSLPDEIIHHILSFNDTKYAVQTCVLSSRWKLIWTTLPYLKFGTDEFRILPKFSKFVSRVLSLRNHQVEVSSVDLYFRGRANQKFVQKIAKYAVSHNVKKVNIFAYELKGKDDREFPICFFSSKSLRHLSVDAHTPWNCVFPLPQSPWDSPALTTVELNNVWLCPDNTMCLDLFSKCVNLMNLTLNHCRSNDLMLMKILCPRLVRLSISRCFPYNYEIVAPNLSYFYYKGAGPLFLSTGGLNSLETVILHLMDITDLNRSNEDMQMIAHEFMNMFCELRNAKFVTLYRPVIEFLKVLDLLEHKPSPFSNLNSLRIEGLERPKKRAKPDMTNQVLNYLLNSSPTATVSKEYCKEMYANNGLDLATRDSVRASELKKMQKEVDDNQAYLTSLAPYLAGIAQRCGIPPPPSPPWFNEASSYLATLASLDASGKIQKQLDDIHAYLTSIASFLAESAQISGMPPPPPPPSLWSNEAGSSAPSSSDGASYVPTVVSPLNDDGQTNDEAA